MAASCGDVSEDVGCHLIVQSQSPGGRMGLYLTLHARARSASIIAYPRCTKRASGAAPREVIPSVAKPRIDRQAVDRSEEHTSELQSLMRNPNAVFRLKRNKYAHHIHTHD